MDATLKRRWINALLSGDYQQGRGTLRQETLIENEDGWDNEVQHCCLGVLCDIANLATITSTGNMVTRVSQNKNAFSDEELVELGIDPKIGSKLIQLNDGEGEECVRRDFRFIAGYIEAAIPGVYANYTEEV